MRHRDPSTWETVFTCDGCGDELDRRAPGDPRVGRPPRWCSTCRKLNPNREER